MLLSKIGPDLINPNEISGTCLDIFSSRDPGLWVLFKAKTSGTLVFTISPSNDSIDIDFALFDLGTSFQNCENKKFMRCNATSYNCNHNTGLDFVNVDTIEDFNCDAGEDGFLKFVDLVEGNYYACIISDFSQAELPVRINWGGTAVFDDICAPLPFDKNNANSLIQFFPNPSSDFLQLQIQPDLLEKDTHLELYNPQGQLVLNSPIKEFSSNIEIQQLELGVYFAIIRQSNGNIIFSKKWIKK